MLLSLLLQEVRCGRSEAIFNKELAMMTCKGMNLIKSWSFGKVTVQ
jgi:hypothetical protein